MGQGGFSFPEEVQEGEWDGELISCCCRGRGSSCARASRHPLLRSGEGSPKHTNVLLFPIPSSAMRGQAACGQVWQLPGLGLGVHECLRELSVPFLDVPGQSC